MMKNIGFSFILFILFQTSISASTISVKEKLNDAKTLIESGNVNLAHLLLENLLIYKDLTKAEKYTTFRYIAKAHLIELDYINFLKYSKKAFELVKNQSPIYEAQYLSERTYYYHYLTWGDSTTFYANKANKILQKHKKEWHLVNIPFIYQMQAIARLYYRPTGTIQSKFDMPNSRNEMFNYYDSAIYFSKKYPYEFKCDLSNVYRAIGNRHLDMVSEYRYISKEEQKKLSKLSWYCFFQAKKNYEKANQLLPKNNYLERFTNNSLIGLNYMCIGERNKAKFIFDKNQKDYISKNKTIPSPKNILNGLTYARVNSFNLPYEKTYTNNSIRLLESTLPAYFDLLKYSNTKLYDTYWISPYLQLYNHYARRYLHTHNESDIRKAADYLNTEKSIFNLIHDSISINNYRQKKAQAELENLQNKTLKNKLLKHIRFSKPTKKPTSFPLLNCQKIQEKLKPNEGLLLSHPCHVFLDNYKMYITHKKIFLLKSKENTELNSLNIDTLNLSEFKEVAFKGYQDELYNVLKIHPKVRKIYTMYNDYNRYSIMINSRKGKNFKELKYLSKQIEFYSIYSLPIFFQSKKKNNNSKVDFIKLENDTLSSLPYSWDFAKNFKTFKSTHKKYKGNIKHLLQKQGILHLIGHGNIKRYEQILNMSQVSLPNSFQTINWGSIGNENVKRDIVIYNNCESGIQTAYTNEYDKGLYLNLLYRGVKQVIVNPSKVDDKASSLIFEIFYKELKLRKSPNRALFLAQQKYLHRSDYTHAHPMYWYPFKVISRE